MGRLYDFFLNHQSGKTRLILIYRYLSWAITSIFYLFSAPHTSYIFKIGVVGFLFIALLLVQHIFLHNEATPAGLKALVFAETVGITLLLLPTGGIDSPFIWYTLNPVLIAASYLSGLFCWGLLFFYMSFSSILTHMLFSDSSLGLIDLVMNNSYLFLVWMLITIVFQLFGNITNELQSQAITLQKQQKKLLLTNKKLIQSNKKTSEAMEHIMSLYQLIESITAQRNIHMLVKTVLHLTEKLTKAKNSFCWLEGEEKQNLIITPNQRILTSEMQEKVKQKWLETNKRLTPFSVQTTNNKYHVVAIKSSTYQGFLGIDSSSHLSFNDIKLLKFISDLTSVIIERFSLDAATEQFLIVEEQNRIANEIHDSVSQRVFGIVCGLHSLQKKLDILSTENLMKEIQFLSESANLTMKELRTSIYQLSTKKRGEIHLFVKINEYLHDIEHLHKISVSSKLIGEEEQLSLAMKKAIYRMISEACGNAIKHGKCHGINVSLNLHQDKLVLSIVDDGIGFNSKSRLKENDIGIGLYNMNNLAQSFGGTCKIHSKPNHGTSISIILPLANKIQEVTYYEGYNYR